MATNFKYAGISDLTKYFNRVDDFDSKRQIFPTETSGNNHFFRNDGYVDSFFINGSEQAAAQSDFDNVNGDGQWCYRSDNNDLKFQASYYSSTTINEQVFEAGQDFTTYLEQSLVESSLELHNYLDARYSTPIEKSKQVDVDTNPILIVEEYDPILIKASCYVAAANLIRAKEGMSEEADYYHSLVTNIDRTGLIDKLNDGVYKLSHEVDDNSKKGKILRREISGSMDLVELSGIYTGGNYDLIKVRCDGTGVYGAATFNVQYFGNDKLLGQESSSEIITGNLQHIHSGISGRWQGNSCSNGDYWEIEVYGNHVQQTNKSNATIEMIR